MNTLARNQLLARRFRAIRQESMRLIETLTPEDCTGQSMPDASPAKWHLAHTTWFFETFVLKREVPSYSPEAPDSSEISSTSSDPDTGGTGIRVFDPRFEYLFNSYYNSVGDQYSRSDRGLLTRPTLDEVRRYRAHVDEAIVGLLKDSGRLSKQSLDIIELGLHHEQQHQELLLTDIKHLFAQNPLAPIYRSSKESDSVALQPVAWHPFEGGLVEIGHHGSTFAFDNETPRHRVYLEPFELASRAVCNREFAAFVEDGGYERPEFWLSEGWATVENEGWSAPLYWSRDGSGWSVFTLSGVRPLDEREAVCHVSFFEADAFARWAGHRLPTEAEWEYASEGVPVEGNLLEAQGLHPAAAPVTPEGAGPSQLFGDVWEWTASPYVAYPGFRAVDGALGEYNGKFMSSQMVLRGGSCVSSRSHLRSSYRNFFPPDARWQFSGLRLARDASRFADREEIHEENRREKTERTAKKTGSTSPS
jgi:ergothioneine biosynthesis protein EgtB